jgi:hypothetical protein
MKKTKTIQLVLITAALASCNRPAYPTRPDESDPEYTPDSTYYEATADSACPFYYSYASPSYYPYYTGTYLPGWDFNFFFDIQPTVYHRKGGVVRHIRYIPRGGFGKLGVTTTAS